MVAVGVAVAVAVGVGVAVAVAVVVVVGVAVVVVVGVGVVVAVGVVVGVGVVVAVVVVVGVAVVVVVGVAVGVVVVVGVAVGVGVGVVVMTPEEIRAARELCEKATPEPWMATSDYPNQPDIPSRGNYRVRVQDEHFPDDPRYTVDVPTYTRRAKEDADFIAAARTLLPKALDALEEARIELDRMRDVIKAARHVREKDRSHYGVNTLIDAIASYDAALEENA